MKWIPARLKHCILGGEILTYGSEYISHLDLDGKRSDYCLNCWEKIPKPKEGSYWKGKIPLKSEKKQRPDAQALQLFYQLKDPKYRYVLALYLQRKQQLVKRTKTLYEIPETGEVFDIPPIVLSAEESEHIAHSIDSQLHA